MFNVTQKKSDSLECVEESPFIKVSRQPEHLRRNKRQSRAIYLSLESAI